MTDRASAEGLREAIRAALHELGEPGPGYPAPVANAVDMLRAALRDTGSRPDSGPTDDAGRRMTYRGSGAGVCPACGFGSFAHECPVASTPRTETSDGLLDAERDALL